MKKRIAAVICAIAVVICQAVFVVPVIAETNSGIPGEVLSVRVQYAGEREDKIREKVSYTAAELKGMGSAVYRYTNVTEVGTVLQIVAVGPPVLNIIEEANIDINSIKMITFKTRDGYSRTFTVGEHLTSTRYYYPNLPKNYQRNGDAGTLIPLPGSLADAQRVPSILALESDSTKNPTKTPKEDNMDTDEAFRFCLGQPPLEEGLETVPHYDGGDVSSMNSAQFIYGIDITLYGSPVKGIGLSIDETDLKVGSEKKITAIIECDELFADEFGFTADDLTWSSSAPDIVSVSADGTITVLQEGTAVITATAPNGMTASITINASGEAEDDDTVTAPEDTEDDTEISEQEEEDKSEPESQPTGDSKNDSQGGAGEGDDPDKKTDKKTETVEGLVVKEVSLEEMVPESISMHDADREEMAMDARALEEAEQTNPVTVLLSGYTAVLAAGFGAAFRVRRYFKEV